MLASLACLAEAPRAGTLDGAPERAVQIRQRDDAVIVRLNAAASDQVFRQFQSDLSLASGEGRGASRTSAALHRVVRPEPPVALRTTAGALGIRLEPEFPATWAALRTGTASTSPLSGYWIAHLPPGLPAGEALAMLRASADVDIAFPIALAPVTAIPNDSLWSTCDHLYQPGARHDVHAPEAWDVTRGDTSVVVGILDTGVLLWHPDLAGTAGEGSGNLWINVTERDGAPGVDDDGNGYADDVHGWDFIAFRDTTIGTPGEDVLDEDGDPNDFVGHGTGVAGVVGAITDNRRGVAGVAWSVRLMPLRVGWSSPQRPSGEIDITAVARALDYATRMGVQVVNGSFATVSQPDLAAAAAAAIEAGMVIVVAAGNFGSPHDLADHPDVIGVAALDSIDHVTGFSNTGDYVDVAAAGLFVSTTAMFKDLKLARDSVAVRRAAYTTTASGTSFSSPIVAGAVALLQARRRALGLPPMSSPEALDRLVDTADDVTAANPGRTGLGAGRVNAYRLLTDPPASWRARLSATIVGAFAVLPGARGGSRIAAALADRSVVLLDGDDGRRLWKVTLGGTPTGGVAVAAMEDGFLGLFVATTNGAIYGLDASGRVLAGWPVFTTGVVGAGPLLPAAADVDGDDRPDVVVGGADGQVWAWDLGGRLLEGFPVHVGSSTLAPAPPMTVALADLDSTRGREIVAVLRTGHVNARLAMIDPKTARVAWTAGIGAPALAPIVVDVGHSNHPAVVVAGNQFVSAYDAGGSLLWRRELPAIVSGAIAAGDVDGDGADEVCVAHEAREIAVLDSAGTISAVIPMADPSGYTSRLPSIVIGPAIPESHGVAWITGRQLSVRPAAGAMPAGFPRVATLWSSLAYGPTLTSDRASLLATSERGRPELRCIALAPGTALGAAPAWSTDRGDAARTGSRHDPPPEVRVDDVAPATIADLVVASVETHSATVQWTAPADKVGRVDRYELRSSTRPISESDFLDADPVDTPRPSAAGTTEMAMVVNLPERQRIHFAIRSIDAAGNASAISNSAQTTTTSIAPRAIADLRLRRIDAGSVVLEWTASGDDGDVGDPARYDVRTSAWAFDAAGFDSVSRARTVVATVSPGGREQTVIDGLERGARYWIAVVAEDAAGNRSAPSNVVTAQAGPLAGLEGAGIAAGRQPARVPVELYWQLEAAGTGELSIYDVGGRRLRSITLPAARDGVARWDGLDDQGVRARPGIYFARLSDGSRDAVGRIVLIE